jgi:hypothetical protein
LESHNDSTKSVQTPTGEVTIISGKIDTKMQQDILAARREIMLQKIAEAEEKLAVAQKQLDAQLRNARHLQILAPIQQKTREQVILAAGRMAAQLKWGRLEIWRLKCHKDILTMDLEEERSSDGSISRINLGVETPASERTALARLHSKASTLGQQRTPRSPTTHSANRPSTANQQSSQQETENVLDDIFQSPPALTSTSSFHKTQASWELPPLSFNGRSDRKASFSSSNVPTSPSIGPTPSRGSTKLASESQRAETPTVDAAEQAVLEQAGLVDTDKTPEGKRPVTGPDNEESRDSVLEKEKLDRGKIRRSLHRTLRDAHVPTHSRSRKGKDSASSGAMSEETKDDVLARGTGSFVVHGKKASVITFGSELQSMSPDERLRLRRQAHKDEPGFLSPASIDDDFHSVLAEPVEFHERHGSAATTSTATARSFRELHKKLAAHGSGGPAFVRSYDDDDDSEAAASFSEGRRTPLPPGIPMEDEDEGVNDNLASPAMQATFYTPEASNSPTRTGFSGKSLAGTSDFEEVGRSDEGNELGIEKIPSPPQAIVSA